MERTGKELERTLRTVKRFEKEPLNRDAVEAASSYECLDALAKLSFIRYCDGRGNIDDYHEYNRIERTVQGRAYFGERRRDRVERYGPAFMGIAGTLLGVVVGAWLAAARPFG